MSKNEHSQGPADAGNNLRHIKPTNESRSFKRGGSVLRDAHRGTEGREMHISGGTGTQPKLDEDGGNLDLGY